MSCIMCCEAAEELEAFARRGYVIVRTLAPSTAESIFDNVPFASKLNISNDFFAE